MWKQNLLLWRYTGLLCAPEFRMETQALNYTPVTSLYYKAWRNHLEDCAWEKALKEEASI